MLAEDEERALRARGITRRFRRGAILLREGEEPTRVLVLTEGRTKAVTFTEEGREVVLGFMGPGSLLGEVATIQNRPRSATVTALEPCTALALAAGDFWALLEEHPRIWIAVHKVVIGRLRLADLQRKEFSGSNTLSRVSRRLVELTDRARASGRRRRHDHAPADPGGARRLDRRLARGGRQVAAHPARPRLDRDRPALDLGPRQRRPAPVRAMIAACSPP